MHLYTAFQLFCWYGPAPTVSQCLVYGHLKYFGGSIEVGQLNRSCRLASGEDSRLDKIKGGSINKQPNRLSPATTTTTDVQPLCLSPTVRCVFATSAVTYALIACTVNIADRPLFLAGPSDGDGVCFTLTKTEVSQSNFNAGRLLRNRRY